MMKRMRRVNLIGTLAVLAVLQWSLYGCGGGGSGTPQSTGPDPLETYADPATGMEFVLVEGDCFDMGNNFSSEYLPQEIEYELPVHRVCIDSFYMGRYPVTQGEWEAIMGGNPSFFKDCGPDCPVELVSWNDVQLFLEKLNAVGEKTFRLPTETEWEFAARNGGKLQKYAGTSEEADEAALPEYAWHLVNSGKITHPVGLKRSNELGIFEMSGNVLEWVQDWFGSYSATETAQINPLGPSSGQWRVVRSSGCLDESKFLRASMRDFALPDFKAGTLGFRLAFPAEP